MPGKSSSPPSAVSPVLIGAVVLALAAVVALAAFLLLRDDDSGAAGGQTSTDSDVERPEGALPDGGGVVISEAEGVPQIHLYEDFQCPWCGVLEENVGSDLMARANDGEIGLTITMMMFLDQNLDNDASSRATNAAMCAADVGAFADYHGVVFAGQPEEEGQGWSDEQLMNFAQEAGITGADLEDVQDCYADREFAAYVEAMNQRALDDEVSGTPTIVLDGETVDDEALSGLLVDGQGLESILGASR